MQYFSPVLEYRLPAANSVTFHNEQRLPAVKLAIDWDTIEHS
jgi:hypothetical protein